jgi:hypothetical protein
MVHVARFRDFQKIRKTESNSNSRTADQSGNCIPISIAVATRAISTAVPRQPLSKSPIVFLQLLPQLLLANLLTDLSAMTIATDGVDAEDVAMPSRCLSLPCWPSRALA